MTPTEIIDLVHRRDALQAELAAIDARLTQLAAGELPAPMADAARQLPAAPGKRRACGCSAFGRHRRGCTGEPPAAEDEEPEDAIDVEAYDYLVVSVAEAVGKNVTAVDREDLVGWGRVGLLQAAARFDRRPGVKFSTFAYWRIRGAMIDGLRACGIYSRSDVARFRDGLAVTVVNLDEAAPVADSAVPAPDDAADMKDVGERVRAAIATLPTKERRLLEAHYFGHKTLEEAGAAMGLSRSWASRVHARAVEILRPMLADAA